MEPITDSQRNRVVALVRATSHHWTVQSGSGMTLDEPVKVDGRSFRIRMFGTSSARVFEDGHPEVEARCTPFQVAQLHGLTR